MGDSSPARQGFYEGVYESYEQGYTPAAISRATGLSLPRVHEIITAERARRRHACCICQHPATGYVQGLLESGDKAGNGLYACDLHEEFVARGIVFGNNYAGCHVERLKAEERPAIAGVPIEKSA
jgi:hypothetical protein